LFVDLTIPAGAPTGSCALRISSPGGTTSAPFAITKPLADGQHGFSPDDVIYLIMPDRFANGDPSNDDPAISRGLYDRSKPRYYHGGDLAGGSAKAGLSERPRSHRHLAHADLRQREPPERAREIQRPGHHRIITAMEPSISTASTSILEPWRSIAP
jgi:hypothetical protein